MKSQYSTEMAKVCMCMHFGELIINLYYIYIFAV